MPVITSAALAVTEGANNKISSAYSTMYVPKWTLNNLPTSSTYTAKRYGDRTDPYLTPEETLNANDQLQCQQLTHAKQSDSQFSSSPSNSTGIFRFISFIYKALWFTLLKALFTSIEQNDVNSTASFNNSITWNKPSDPDSCKHNTFKKTVSKSK